ncbi:MAG: DUF501 domain-containing protein [Planctomycetota bacterium]
MRQTHADLRTDIVRACPDGHPLVLRCHPLRRSPGRPVPFPTLYWLACCEVDRQVAELERAGWIARVQSRLRTDDQFRMSVAADHESYIEQRWERLSPEEQADVRAHGLETDFLSLGIGGIRDFNMVKCLHLHYAHHLADANSIGAWLDQEGLIQPCRETRHPGGAS